MTQEEASRIKRRHADQLMKIPGVVGVGVEKDDQGRFVLAVHFDARKEGGDPPIPDHIDNCPVKLIRSGPFRKRGRGEEKTGDRP